MELDSLTGRIAKQLYPKAKIQITGFEKTEYPDDFFDVAVGNVPFGDYKVFDKKYDKYNLLIHDYFFAKSIDKVRQGGVVAMITSNGISGGTFDKRDSRNRSGAGTNVQDRLIAEHHLDVPWRSSDIEQREGRIIRQGNQNEKVHIFRYVTEGTFDSYSWQLIENKQKFISQIMTSKSSVRSCEDVDEASLTYAEVKALATGNPYIKEKMDLDIQVSKLKLLKANHTSQIYRMEDNIAKHYSKKIGLLKERITAYQMDVDHYQEVKPADKEAFAIKLGERIYTEKKEAGTALIAFCRQVKTPGVAAPIGEYLGYKMSVEYDTFYHKFTLNLKGALTHSIEVGADAFGNLTRINNVLDAMEGKMAQEQEALDNTEKQLANGAGNRADRAGMCGTHKSIGTEE